MGRILVYMVVGVALIGCHPFEYHPYEARLERKYENVNRKNLEWLREKEIPSDTVRFVFMGDSQRWYDETEDFVRHVNQREDIDFVIHGGDLSDFGMKKEFCWMVDILGKLHFPHLVIVGNHDHLGTGGEIYRTMYGDLNFSFLYRGIKFLCLNTNALDFDYSVPVPDFQFLQREMADTVNQSYTQTIAMMHVPPGNEIFNNNVKEVFHEYLKRFRRLRFCVHAHDHALKVRNIFKDGIVYYGSDAMVHRNYLLFTVTPEEYTYEVVYF